MFGAREGRAIRSRTDPAHGRVLIAGTGRAGTTLLVQLFTRLGFDTGLTLAEAFSQVDEISHAGLEHDVAVDSHVIVKSPNFAVRFNESSSLAAFGVYFVVVPMRNLQHAAESRRRVSRVASERGRYHRDYAGGLWLTDSPSDQERMLTDVFYKTMSLILKSELDPVLIEFPRLARDADYIYRRMLPLWQVYGIGPHELRTALADVVDEKKINLG